MDLRAVVFDLDGTLVDHAGAARAGVSGWLTALGVEPTAELQRAWSAAEARHFPAWRDGLVTFAEQRRRRLREVLPLLGRSVGGDAELDEHFAAYLVHYRRAWRGFDDAAPAVEAVRAAGLATAVLTNGQGDQQRAKLAHLGLLARIGPVLAAGELGVAKPAPAAFAAACAELALPPGQVLYVGDEHEVDVLGARAAGLRAVLLDRCGTGPRTEPERITTLADLPALLRAGGRPGATRA